MKAYQSDIFEVHSELVKRYIELLSTDSASRNLELINMCKKFIEEGNNMPPDKQGRWVGYIQSELISKNLSTVDKERLISRPMFHRVYDEYNLSVRTISI